MFGLTTDLALIGFMGLGFTEIIVIGAIAVMLFGAKLPDVARNAGRGYKQLRKQINDLQADLDVTGDLNDVSSTVRSSTQIDYDDDREEATAPKFEPPPK